MKDNPRVLVGVEDLRALLLGQEDTEQFLNLELALKYKDNEVQIVWCLADILYRAEGTDISISEEDGKQILRELLYDHDRYQGITWETIDYYLEKYSEEK